MIYCVSDIHGELDKLERMMELIRFSDADHLYIIGDVIDRGVMGVDILRWIMAAPNMTMLLGNHEQMCLDTLGPKNEFGARDLWRQNGGMPTYRELLYHRAPIEKTREAADLANVRSAYAQVSAEALLGNSETTVTVDLKQKRADWQSVDPVNIGGIVHYKKQGDTNNWKGVAAPNGTCVVSYNENYGIILTWSGKADPSAPKYPFNTSVTDFFPLLYSTDFWKNGAVNTHSNFEFDSRCPKSDYVPAIYEAIGKLDNSLLQQPDCT